MQKLDTPLRASKGLVCENALFGLSSPVARILIDATRNHGHTASVTKLRFPAKHPNGERVAPLEYVLLLLGIALFVTQSYCSSLFKSPAGDTLIHYGYGEQLLGLPTTNNIHFARHGTMPVSILFVLFAQLRDWMVPLLGPADTFTWPGLDLPSSFWSSLPVLIMGVVLQGLLWQAVRRICGRGPALCTLLLSVLEPNLIAHSHYATTDIPSTLGFFGGCAALDYYLRRPVSSRSVLLAIALALAQLTKLPNLVLYPIAIALIAIRHHSTPPPSGLRGWKLLSQMAILSVQFAAFFVAALQIAYCRLPIDAFTVKMSSSPHYELVTTYAPGWWALRPIIPTPYTYTVAYANLFNFLGNWSYLLGEYRKTGWWYYYPIAIAVKTPLPVLLLAGVGLITFIARPARYALEYLLLPALIYLIYFCFFISSQIGVRLMLPVYPALLALAGIGLFTLADYLSRLKWIPALVVGFGMALESYTIFPHYEEYFNQLAGGPYYGWRWLADSNIDFGQETRIIEEWQNRQKRPVYVDPQQPVEGLILSRVVVMIGTDKQTSKKMKWLRDNFEPSSRPTPALMVFDITHDQLVEKKLVPETAPVPHGGSHGVPGECSRP